MTTTRTSIPSSAPRSAAPSRLPAAAAGTYVGAWLVGLALTPAAPSPDAAAEHIADHYLGNGAAVLASSALVHGVAGVALGVFAVSLAASVRARGGLRRAVVGTGLAASALSLAQVAIAATAVTVAHADAGRTATLFDARNLVDVLKIALLASFVAVATRASSRTRRLPRWLLLLATALVPTLVVGSAALVAPTPVLSAALAASLIGLLVWAAAVGLLVRRADR
jgi:hypothetical protein